MSWRTISFTTPQGKKSGKYRKTYFRTISQLKNLPIFFLGLSFQHCHAAFFSPWWKQRWALQPGNRWINLNDDKWWLQYILNSWISNECLIGESKKTRGHWWIRWMTDIGAPCCETLTHDTSSWIRKKWWICIGSFMRKSSDPLKAILQAVITDHHIACPRLVALPGPRRRGRSSVEEGASRCVAAPHGFMFQTNGVWWFDQGQRGCVSVIYMNLLQTFR